MIIIPIVDNLKIQVSLFFIILENKTIFYPIHIKQYETIS